MTRLLPTASQTVGPFFSVGLDREGWSDLTLANPEGRRIRIEGRLLDGDRQPVSDALIEIWQANAAGRYAHPEDTQERPLDPGFRGYGRCATDAGGCWAFTTIRPGPVPGRGNTLQAPHINLGIFARGLLNRLTTRLYFAGDPLNDTDPVMSLIEDRARRRTLLAEPRGEAIWYLDVILQGDGETVFLDV